MTVSRTVTQEKIDEAVRRLVEVARPSRIILFGSAARGELDERSDIDLMVVLPEPPEPSHGRKGPRGSKSSDTSLPHTWLVHARSDLAAARVLRANPDILPEQAGFHAQQAIEKAIKAVLLARNVDIPYAHDVQDLVEEITRLGMAVPTEVTEAKALTRFAVEMRYPSAEEIADGDIDEAIRIAEATVAWATPLVPLPGT